MRRKIGLSTAEAEDQKLIEDLLSAMHRSQADFTLTFRALCDASPDPLNNAALKSFLSGEAARDWPQRWQARLAREADTPRKRVESMRQANPALVPRNHRIEQMIAAAVEQADFAPFERLLTALARPFEHQPGYADLGAAPQAGERVLRTFCGT
jgi:uncharacterized protein YdiU (UPF0061 family)